MAAPKPTYVLKYSTDSEFRSGAVELLKEHGVLVVTDVFSAAECEETMTQLVTALEAISDGFTHKDLRTWKEENLPPMVRSGLFQSMMGNLPPVVAARSDPRVRDLFTTLYSGLRGEKVDDFVTSLDGINIRPPVEPFYTDASRDWAHIDISKKNAMFECVQGQLVLTPTTAGFRCSPQSHKKYEHYLDTYGGGERPGNWCLFKEKDQKKIAAEVLKDGGEWQSAILAPPGSMIFWFSSTIHSARCQTKLNKREMNKLPDSRWKNWRGVIYICLRPKEEVNDKHLARLQYAFDENRMTNHWGEKVFPSRPATRKGRVYSEKIQALIKNPTKVFELKGLKPKMTREWHELMYRPEIEYESETDTKTDDRVDDLAALAAAPAPASIQTSRKSRRKRVKECKKKKNKH